MVKGGCTNPKIMLWKNSARKSVLGIFLLISAQKNGLPDQNQVIHSSFEKIVKNPFLPKSSHCPCNQTYDKQNKKNVKKNFGNGCCSGGYASKTE
jgi:hypothetical protein